MWSFAAERFRSSSTVNAGDITVRVLLAHDCITVAVVGRVTVDSSPKLRATLLDLLCRKAAPLIHIELSGVSYLDTSGLATLLETLKAAHNRSVTLRVTGIGGAARTLAQIAQLDMIFREWGSQVEFR